VTCAGADGTDANAEMVRSGMAWVFDKYVTDRGLYAVQDEARAARRGLWLIMRRHRRGNSELR
jgi:endonuclease YncB( thermonuclease family)